jgi:hypothetical protein
MITQRESEARRREGRRRLVIACLAAVGLTLLGGCATREERVATTPPPAPPPVPERVVTHSTGRYELRGEGTTASPFYWVWIPTGATLVAVPAVPAAPTVIVTQPAQRVVTHSEGRYELRGDGTQVSPYYWVWVPTGSSPPPPPPLPRR